MKYVIGFIILLISLPSAYAQPRGLIKASEQGAKTLEKAERVVRVYSGGVKVGLEKPVLVYPSVMSSVPAASSVTAAVPSAALLQQVTVDMQHLRQIISINGHGGVYRLGDTQQTHAYAKVGSVSEVERTRQAYQLIHTDLVYPGGLRQKYPLIDVESPYILSENTSVLPEAIRLDLDAKITQLRQHKNNSHANLLNRPEGRVFVMSAVDTGGMNLGDLAMIEEDIKDLAWEQADPTGFLQDQMHEKILEYLDGQPISWAEWKQVKGFISDMGQAGLPHGDLGQNLFLKRNPKTHKLKVTLIDFEIIPRIRRTDEQILEKWESILLRYHVLIP